MYASRTWCTHAKKKNATEVNVCLAFDFAQRSLHHAGATHVVTVCSCQRNHLTSSPFIKIFCTEVNVCLAFNFAQRSLHHAGATHVVTVCSCQRNHLTSSPFIKIFCALFSKEVRLGSPSSFVVPGTSCSACVRMVRPHPSAAISIRKGSLSCTYTFSSQRICLSTLPNLFAWSSSIEHQTVQKVSNVHQNIASRGYFMSLKMNENAYVSRSGRNGTLAPKRHFEIRAFNGIGPSLIVPCCYRNSIDHSIEACKPSQDSCQVWALSVSWLWSYGQFCRPW